MVPTARETVKGQPEPAQERTNTNKASARILKSPRYSLHHAQLVMNARQPWHSRPGPAAQAAVGAGVENPESLAPWLA